jgi:glucokinase
MLKLGVDIGGTFTDLVVVGDDRAVLAEGRVPTEAAAGPAPLVERAARAARELAAGAGSTSGGRARSASGGGSGRGGGGNLAACPNLPGWAGSRPAAPSPPPSAARRW